MVQGEPCSVSVNARAFNGTVRELLQIVMLLDTVPAGAALLAAWILQVRGYDLGEQEAVTSEVVDLVNTWSKRLTREAL